MNKIEQEFIERGVAIMQPNDAWFVISKKNAIDFVEACKKELIGILGIDAFNIRETGIQPSLDNSIDFSSQRHAVFKDIYSEAIAFLNQRDEDLYFEVVCSD